MHACFAASEHMGAEHTTAASALALSRENTQPAVGITIRSTHLSDGAQIPKCHLVPGHRLAGKAVLSRRYIQQTEKTQYVSTGQGHLHFKPVWQGGWRPEKRQRWGEGPVHRDISHAFLKWMISLYWGCGQSSSQVSCSGTFDQLDSTFSFLLCWHGRDICTAGWVRNPFLRQTEASYLSLIRKNSWKCLGLQMKFAPSILTQFWVCVKQEPPDLGQKALEMLLPFASTYLCEVSFSAMAVIKTKQRNRLSLEKSLITAVASLSPRLTKILSEEQAQVSH